ncbi:hypothetical protein JYT85_02645 [Desulfocapsa sp. AH-315-G09]|nr:hypothetical protein [Desulfocapsa sp. AH-315-G09]
MDRINVINSFQKLSGKLESLCFKEWDRWKKGEIRKQGAGLTNAIG